MTVPGSGDHRSAGGSQPETSGAMERNSLLLRRRRFSQGLRAVLFGVVSNLGLIVLKAVVGVLGHSEALVADAVHSAADLVNSLLAFASLLVSRRPADITHPYGHGRAEALSANVAAMIIGSAGALVIWGSVTSLVHRHSTRPDWATLWVGLVAMALKLVLAVYTARIARRINSKAVNADARDHQADVLSSGVVVVGILAARLGAPLLDPLAGLIVGGFIIYTAAQIFLGAAHELMDTSLAPEVRAEVIAQAGAVQGIRISGVAGRTIGDMTLVEIHADVDPAISVAEAGRIVDEVKSRLIGCIADVSHVVVELNSGVFEPETLRVER
ncbi:MAG TPA: cation diffusion facilitator family transporter [Dehalococcoidia bacterium]